MCRDILIPLPNSMQHSPFPTIKKKRELMFPCHIHYNTQIQSIPSHPASVRSLVILPTHLHLGLQRHLLSGFPATTPHTFIFSPTHSTSMCISYCLIWSPQQYFVGSTDHEAPSYAIFPRLPIFPHSYTQISAPYSWTSLAHILCLRWQAKFHDIKLY
jgi:hypothetical protein